MTQFDAFAVSAEKHGVVTDDITRADGMDPDLV